MWQTPNLWSKSGGGENFDRTAWLWLGDKAMATDGVKRGVVSSQKQLAMSS